MPDETNASLEAASNYQSTSEGGIYFRALRHGRRMASLITPYKVLVLADEVIECLFDSYLVSPLIQIMISN